MVEALHSLGSRLSLWRRRQYHGKLETTIRHHSSSNVTCWLTEERRFSFTILTRARAHRFDAFSEAFADRGNWILRANTCYSPVGKLSTASFLQRVLRRPEAGQRRRISAASFTASQPMAMAPVEAWGESYSARDGGLQVNQVEDLIYCATHKTAH